MTATVSLDLFAEVTAADGTRYQWDANQGPASRLTNLSFRTKIGEGFSDASGQLARRIDLDYPDLNLADTVTFTGADGSIAYEGQVSALPRDLTDRHSIGVQLAGWMAHAKDRKFQEIYVDRDLGSLGPSPLSRQAAAASVNVSQGDFSFSAQTGKDGAEITVALPNQALGAQTFAETWAMYGIPIARFAYRGKLTNWPVGWTSSQIAGDDPGSALDTPNGLALDDALHAVSMTTARQYVGIQAYSNGNAVTPTSGALLQISKWATYGNHGLTLHTGETGEPDGVYASDVIRDIARRWCPQLDVSGVQDTNYVIQHLAFKDRTYPFDAFLEINKYHLWHLAVWDNRQLVYKPYDLSDYDWEIRTDDPGTTFSPQGPSTEDLFNGIAVTYTDALTGLTKVLTPETNTDLADSSLSNPWNSHGRQHWDEITLSTPTIEAIALQVGRAALADRNRPRTPGTITVRGSIRDRAGNPQPVWKPRAGDTIAITNFPNDQPRLIVETDYDHEAKQIKLAIDKPFALLDAYLDRQANALAARGLA